MESSSAAGQTESINEMEMYYEIHGQGEPLLLLHGFTGSGSNWELVFNYPLEGYRLIIPDMRGHGRSTNPSNEFTHRQSALDVFALLDRLEIDRFKAIGLSGGGNTLLHMATQQPDRVETMILVSATTYFPEQARAIMRQMTPESRSDDEWKLMREWHKHGDEQILALWRHGNAFRNSYDDMNFTPPYLSKIRAKTLIVYGDRDPFYKVDIASEMYKAIPQSYLWIIPNGGHGPILGNTAGRFAETALEFLRDEW